MHDIEIERSMGEEVSNNRNDDHRPEREGGKKPLGRSRCFDGFFSLSLSLFPGMLIPIAFVFYLSLWERENTWMEAGEPKWVWWLFAVVGFWDHLESLNKLVIISYSYVCKVPTAHKGKRNYLNTHTI